MLDFTNAQTITGFVALTKKSRNIKTGPIPVSTSGKETCPNSCPLKDAGCYADGGPMAIFWQKVTEKKAGLAYDTFLTDVTALPDDQLWRHNQEGDLQADPMNGADINLGALCDLTKANTGKRGFTYTHFDTLNNTSNREAIELANKQGFTDNVSGNDFDQADKLAESKAGPVVSIAPIAYGRKSEKKIWTESLAEYKTRLQDLPSHTKAGQKISPCPATYLDTNCLDCGLCQKQNRKVLVVFPAHGLRKKKADLIAQGAA